LKKTKKEMKENMKNFPKTSFKDFKIVHTEIKDSTTEALRDMFSKCGLTLVDYVGLPKEYWEKTINRFVKTAKKQHFVSKVYLTGSLARNVNSSKDADIIMVTDSCPGESCKIRSLLNSHAFGTQIKIIGQGFPLCPIDLYCFDETEFESLEKGNYRIAQNKKLLFQR